MQFDSKLWYFVYPSWCRFSYRWRDLNVLLADPLSTSYLSHRDDWFQLGYSHVTDNVRLWDCPFGNGIIIKDIDKMSDVSDTKLWLPSALLGREANLTSPPGISRISEHSYHVSYLSPKPSDEEALGLKKHQDDPMPYFSIEPLAGLEEGALICIGRAGSSQITEALVQVPAFFLSFGIKCELVSSEDEPSIEKCRDIQAFCHKWRLNSTWYFLHVAGLDLGLLFAILVYLGGYLRSVDGSGVKTCHLITTLENYPSMTPNWRMMKLR